MDKLQYDSFYKFVISVGIVLFVSPVLLLHFWLSGSYDVVLVKQELESLTDESSYLLKMKLQFISKIYESMYWILGVIIAIMLLGIVMVIWGCYKWYQIQKNLDEISGLDVTEKYLHIQEMTPDEIVEKAKEETLAEETSSFEKKESDKEDLLIPSETKSRISRSLEVERLCLEKLQKTMGKNYKVHCNVRVEKYEYDMIAYSKKDNIDKLYEIKYWSSYVAKATFICTIKQMVNAEINYEMYAHRNKQSILIIVSNQDAIKDMKSKKLNEIARQNNIEIQFWNVEDLYSNRKIL